MREFTTAELEAMPRTPKAAKAAGLRLYSNGKPCPEGHISARRASTGRCEICTQLDTVRTSKRLREERRQVVLNMEAVCQQCGMTFTPEFGRGKRSAAARHCSAECRKAADRQSKQRWLEENPEKRKEVASAWARKMTEEKGDAWEKARQRNTTYIAGRLATDPQYRLAHNCRTRINMALRTQQAGKSRRSPELLGCTIPQLIEHVEAQFKPGMTWDNWARDGWHLDHIRPLASFDLTDPEQQKQAFHFSNLQPLWASENLSKGDGWDGWEEEG
jgi:hypothetical protein